MCRPLRRLRFYDRVSFKAALFAPAESQRVGAKQIAGYDAGGMVGKAERDRIFTIETDPSLGFSAPVKVGLLDLTRFPS